MSIAESGPQNRAVEASGGIGAGPPEADHTLARAIRIQGRVIGALMLRDMRTRFGGTYISYSVAVLWPLTHLLILLAVYLLAGRAPSYGTDLFAWVMSGTLPFVVFLYTTRLVAVSLNSNAALVTFSIVKRIDIIIARALVELVTALLIATAVLAVYVAVHGSFAFASLETCLLAVLSAYLAGLSFGVFGAPLVRVVPMLMMVIYMLCIVCWVTAGVIYLPDSVPEPYHSYFALNPLVHCSELFRTGLYIDYQSRTLDMGYFLKLTSVLLLSGLVLERVMPRLAGK